MQGERLLTGQATWAIGEGDRIGLTTLCLKDGRVRVDNFREGSSSRKAAAKQ